MKTNEGKKAVNASPCNVEEALDALLQRFRTVERDDVRQTFELARLTVEKTRQLNQNGKLFAKAVYDEAVKTLRNSVDRIARTDRSLDELIVGANMRDTPDVNVIIRYVLKQLKPLDVKIFCMVYLQGIKKTAVAKAVGLSPSEVTRRHQRARAIFIRKYLSEFNK